MKFLVFLTIAALVGSSVAVDDDEENIDVKEEIKNKFNQFLEKVKKIGIDALTNAAKQALDAINASLIDILTDVLESGINALGKRGLKEDAIAKVAEIYGNVKEIVEKKSSQGRRCFCRCYR